MNEENNQKSIKEKVLLAIKDGQALMKPRWHFVLKSALLVLGSIISFLFLLLFVSFIIFILRQNGLVFAPRFGLRGFGILFMSLPWILILASLLFFLVLEVLVRKYSYSYKKPIIYSLFVVVVFVAGSSLLVHYSGFHRAMFERSRDTGMPVFGKVYRDFGMRENPNIHPGMINGFYDQGFYMLSRGGREFTVLVNSKTHFPGREVVVVGDHVMVLGGCECERDFIEAEEVRKIDPRVVRFPKRMPPRMEFEIKMLPQ